MKNKFVNAILIIALLSGIAIAGYGAVRLTIVNSNPVSFAIYSWTDKDSEYAKKMNSDLKKVMLSEESMKHMSGRERFEKLMDISDQAGDMTDSRIKYRSIICIAVGCGLVLAVVMLKKLFFS